MTHQITIESSGETYPCGPHETVLEGMVRLGRGGISVGCRGGGCGICKVQVTAGIYDKRAMSSAHVNGDDLREGRVLACRILPRSDLTLWVIGKMRAAWR